MIFGKCGICNKRVWPLQHISRTCDNDTLKPIGPHHHWKCVWKSLGLKEDPLKKKEDLK